MSKISIVNDIEICTSMSFTINIQNWASEQIWNKCQTNFPFFISRPLSPQQPLHPAQQPQQPLPPCRFLLRTVPTAASTAHNIISPITIISAVFIRFPFLLKYNKPYMIHDKGHYPRYRTLREYQSRCRK